MYAWYAASWRAHQGSQHDTISVDCKGTAAGATVSPTVAARSEVLVRRVRPFIPEVLFRRIGPFAFRECTLGHLEALRVIVATDANLKRDKLHRIGP